jgi:rubredoxin-NAD+ reductase
MTDADIMAQELNAKIYCQSIVTAINPIENTLTFNQHTVKFSRLVFACGAETIMPQLTGDAVHEVQTVNNLGDYRQFRQWLDGKKHIAILGSGLVGCEFANDLINAGYAVTVIAPDTHPLMTVLPAVVGRLLQEMLAKQGVIWKLGHFTTAISHHGQQYAITLANGQIIFADGVFSAVGLRPQINLARQAGISVNRGIVVNRLQQTNFSHIFALGDCAEVDGLVQMYVAPLLQSARALAKILAGGHDPVHFPVMPIVLKTPAFPLVFMPPPARVIGAWHIEGEGHHLRALFQDESGQLHGFVLAGDKIRDKMTLAKQLPLIFSE